MKCIHCLKDVSNITKDHVFPKSWFTADTPTNMEKPKAPSCHKCNNDLGKIENRLFVQLAGCVDPKKAEASGIKEKLLKDLGINQPGLPDNEREIRKKKAKRLLESARAYDPKIHKAFPGLGPHKGYPARLQYAFPAPHEDLIIIAKKTIKGLEYIYENRYIDPPLKVKVYHVDVEPEELTALLNNFADRKTYGPGFLVERAKSENEVLYKCTIWGTWIYYGSIEKT